jgi:hypothetical protein
MPTYCDYLGSESAVPRRSGPVEVLTGHEPVSRLPRETAASRKTTKAAHASRSASNRRRDSRRGCPIGPTRLGRRTAQGNASRTRQDLPHGGSNVVAVEIRRSILPNRSATSQPRRGRDYERALAVGTKGAEIPAQSRPWNGAGQCRER